MAVANGVNGGHNLHAVRGTFRIFTASQFVVFMTLFAVRFVLSGTSTDANANIYIGIIEVILVLAGGWAAIKSLHHIRSDDRHSSLRMSLYASYFGFAAFLVMVYQWRALGLSLTDRYGESYYVVTGFWMLYMFVASVLFWAMRVRDRRIPFTAEHHWEVEAATTFYQIPLLGWIATFVLLYLV